MEIPVSIVWIFTTYLPHGFKEEQFYLKKQVKQSHILWNSLTLSAHHNIRRYQYYNITIVNVKASSLVVYGLQIYTVDYVQEQKVRNIANIRKYHIASTPETT